MFNPAGEKPWSSSDISPAFIPPMFSLITPIFPIILPKNALRADLPTWLHWHCQNTFPSAGLHPLLNISFSHVIISLKIQIFQFCFPSLWSLPSFRGSGRTLSGQWLPEHPLTVRLLCFLLIKQLYVLIVQLCALIEEDAVSYDLGVALFGGISAVFCGI